MLAFRDSRIAKDTNHDAAPAATASVESVAPQPTTRGDSARTDKAESRPSEGTGDTLSESPNLVSADYRESVAIKYLSWLWAGDSTTDVAVLAEKAFRLADEELARHAKYQCSDRSQPVKDDVSDRSKPISDDRLAALEQLSALDQELELKHGIKGNPMIKAQQRTPPSHATPPQGSVRGEGIVPDSRTENEPVAWWLRGTEPATGCEYEYVSLVRESADAAAKEGGTVTPLYRAPTLTDEEREAINVAMHRCDGPEFKTLRKLLERLA